MKVYFLLSIVWVLGSGPCQSNEPNLISMPILTHLIRQNSHIHLPHRPKSLSSYSAYSLFSSNIFQGSIFVGFLGLGRARPDLVWGTTRLCQNHTIHEQQAIHLWFLLFITQLKHQNDSQHDLYHQLLELNQIICIIL